MNYWEIQIGDRVVAGKGSPFIWAGTEGVVSDIDKDMKTVTIMLDNGKFDMYHPCHLELIYDILNCFHSWLEGAKDERSNEEISR